MIMSVLKRFCRIISVLVPICLFSCSSPKTGEAKGDECGTEDHVEVIYFYGKMRCKTCQAIEALTKETVESTFKDEVKAGKVVLRAVNIGDNPAMVDEYEAAGSSLFVTAFADGRQTRKNLTELGFMTACQRPEAFKDSLAATIRQSLETLKQ